MQDSATCSCLTINTAIMVHLAAVFSFIMYFTHSTCLGDKFFP